MEFVRAEGDQPFFEEDEEIANSYLVWGEVAIHYADLYGKVGRQKDMTSFLLSIGKCIIGKGHVLSGRPGLCYGLLYV